ncbi:MAG: DUF3253 domain-containing protein [Bacteroidota bacterium]
MEQKIRYHILLLLQQRGLEKSICPSDVARHLFPEDWRDHMDTVRTVARKLAKEGLIRITQGAETIDPDNFSGPIRLRIN